MPFTPSPISESVFFSFEFQSHNALDEEIFSIAISTKVIDFVLRRFGHRDSYVTVPWSDWGPLYTRCFCNVLNRDSLDSPAPFYHNRFITGEAVFDFNSVSIARDIARGDKENIVTEPSVIESDDSGFFEEDIVSTLPYRKLAHLIPPGPEMPLWMLGEHLMMMDSADIGGAQDTYYLYPGTLRVYS
jgi:hypothetical protein